MGLETAQERIVMLSLLDAAWTAIGRSPKGTQLSPRWETILLDDEGLIEASVLGNQALDGIREVSRLSRERRAVAGEGGPMHLLVAVTSLIDSPEDQASGPNKPS
jgi:hypothetical protein